MRAWTTAAFVFLFSCTEADTGGLLSGPIDGGTPPPPPDGGTFTPPDSGVPIDPPGETFGSGSRLRAVVVDGGGGARRFQAWYDAVLGTYCAFERGTDGELQCLPLASSADRFRSPNCREPSAWVTTCNQSQQYFRHQGLFNGGSNLCGYERLDPALRTGVYRVVGTERVDALYLGDAAACTRDGAQGREALRLEAMPPSEFVAATVTLEERGGLLSVWRVTAEDGAWQDLALVDQTTGRECSPVAGLDRCAPGGALAQVSDDLWQPSCGQPLAVASARPECQPIAAVEYEAPTGPLCERVRARLREIGPAYSGPVHRLTGGQCEPVDGFYPAGLRSVGPLVNREYFPALERRQVGSGRLRVERYFSASQDPLPWTYESFIDTQTGNPCLLVPEAGTPGSSVCVDSKEVAAGGIGYADPGCQVRIGLQLLTDVLDCVAQPRPLVRIPITEANPECLGLSPALELWEAGPEVVGPVYRRDAGGRCEPLDLAPVQGYRLYAHQLGPRLPWDAFPRLQQRVE